MATQRKKSSSRGKSSKGNSNRKTTASRSNAARRTNKKNTTEQISFKSEVTLWVILAVSILLFVSNFGVGGIIGNSISSVFFGLFGLMAYIFPICLFVGSAFYVSNRANYVAIIKLVACFVFFIFLCLFLQMISEGSPVSKVAELYHTCSLNKSGGGVFGGLIAKLLCTSFGKIGTYVIDIIVLIICLVLITEKSFFKGIQLGGKKVYSSAKNERERHSEERRQRREEAQLRRLDNKVTGVALDTTIKPEEAKKSDALNELNAAKIPKRTIVKPVEDLEEALLNQIQEPQSEEMKPVKHVAKPVHEEMFAGLSEDPAMPEDTWLEPKMVASVVTPVSPAPPVTTHPSDVLAPAEAYVDEPETTPPEEPVAEPTKSARKPKRSQEQIAENISEISEEIEQAATDGEQSSYQFPPVDLLTKGTGRSSGDSTEHVNATALKLKQTLQTFGVNVTITDVNCGPAVTRYELQPEMGVKVSKILSLSDDIKLNLAAADIRIEAPIPGKAAIGIEVPNKENVTVPFRELIESADFQKHASRIAFGAGKDIAGKVIVADIAKMPHLLIAGATGSGKSVCINTIIMSILYHAKPDEVKLIMIDPKVVELSVYNGIPHLFIPVVTDPKKAAGALHWAVSEMTDRYQKFAEYNVRDLKSYNKKIETIKDIEDENKPEKLPQIVIIVDELADLMMVAPGDVEDAICRLAQLARAAGIHLIIATQRPSVNVITGLIKANMPSRIAFAVSSGVDSRTIIDMNGAEKLLGKGDMLFYPQGYAKPLRVQGAFVSDKEVSDVVEYLKEQNEGHAYNTDIADKVNDLSNAKATAIPGGGSADEKDTYFVEAGKFVIEKEKGSIGMLQRVFKVGFNRAARIMDQLEEAGVVGPEEGTKPRKVLMSPSEFEQYVEESV